MPLPTSSAKSPGIARHLPSSSCTNWSTPQPREQFALSAQLVVRLIAKVAAAYKRHKLTRRRFRPWGSIAYDDRILTWSDTGVSIWTTSGRQFVPFLADERNRALLGSRRGDSYLVYRDNEWYFYATCDIAEAPLTTAVDFLGVDLGVVNIAVDSSGGIYSVARAAASPATLAG